jgi:glycerate kinase
VQVLVAPDKFKGSLTALEAAKAMAEGVRDVMPEAEIAIVAVADGGEGTHEAAIAAGAEERTMQVRGPDQRGLHATWALLGSRAVIETAKASGLAQVTPTPDMAANASSYGSGQLILKALDSGVDEIIVGLGGSAMTDGGSGALRALGLRVLDKRGIEVPEGGRGLGKATILDTTSLDPRLRTVKIRLASDVNNPLYGPTGAAHVFGRQKGADSPTRQELDSCLRHWAELLKATTGMDVQRPGTGAAGGFPAGFLALANSTIEPGFSLVAELVKLNDGIRDADLVITGEGSLDAQSLAGKAPIGVALRARQMGKPTIAVAGQVELTQRQLERHGILAAASVTECAPSIREGFDDAPRYVRQATRLALQRLSEATRRVVRDLPR